MCMYLYIHIPLGKIEWHGLELLAASRSTGAAWVECGRRDYCMQMFSSTRRDVDVMIRATGTRYFVSLTLNM